MTDIASSPELCAARDGLTQLQRRWPVANPSAAMLIVHGIGEHSARYEHVGQHFAERGIDVLAFDNRGFGQSGGQRAYVSNFDEFLDDVEDLLEKRRELGVPVVLLGHSLGGLIVLTYLMSDRPGPDLAVLSAPALAARIPYWQRLAAPVLGRIAPRLFVKSTIDGALLTHDVEIQDTYENDPLVVAGATAGLGHQIMTTMKRTSALIGNVAVPTYVLHGTEDEIVPVEATELLAKLDNVERRLWDGMRHECFNEPDRDAVLSAVSDWLDKQELY